MYACGYRIHQGRKGIEYEENHVPLKIDLGEEKFRAVLKPYQILAMRYLWANPDGKSSRYVYEAVNEAMEGGSISRASIINSPTRYLSSMR